MPTSNMRSGYFSPKGASPVGPGIAAVIATTSGRVAPASSSAAENTDVQSCADTDLARPVLGSITPVECI
ncbi:Uncharacterised protein [Mycobacteroides abscessus subsp. abscessus]|nr:Uncharacterised protein [Mycobacteroides abscessus subsp. abscessus]